MKKYKSLMLLALLTTMLLSPLAAHAISGQFSDPGGGTYMCNIYVAEVCCGKSYQWCTGIDEAITTVNPMALAEMAVSRAFM